MKKTLVVLVASLAACARPSVGTPAPTASPSPGSAGVAASATATINDGTGSRVGSASFADTPAGLLVSITVNGLGIGGHGAHLHAIGSCVRPAFASAGPHFNPSGKQHGFRNPAGHHAGDMPNIVSPPAGNHTVQFLLPVVRLTGRDGLLDEDGASIVIHSSEDDHRTDPAGNSAARYGCGVITLVK